jgi:hypothetical protein
MTKAKQQQRGVTRYQSQNLKSNGAPLLQDYQAMVGQFIWAQMEGHPPWPSQIIRADLETKREQLYVYFYGPDDSEKWGYIRLDQAFLFTAESSKWFRTKVESHVKKSTEAQSLLAAIDEARMRFDEVMAAIDANINPSDLPLIIDPTSVTQFSVGAVMYRKTPQETLPDSPISPPSSSTSSSSKQQKDKKTPKKQTTKKQTEPKKQQDKTPMKQQQTEEEQSPKIKLNTKRRSFRRHTTTTEEPEPELPEKLIITEEPEPQPKEWIAQTNEDDHGDLCHVCNLGGFLILCDACSNACHLECADPPLSDVPEGIWYCNDCKLKQKQEVEKRIADAQMLLWLPNEIEKRDPIIEEESDESDIEDSEDSDSDSGKSSSKSTPKMINNYFDDVRVADPFKRILVRRYWSGLSVKSGSSNRFQMFQNELEMKNNKRKTRNTLQRSTTTISGTSDITDVGRRSKQISNEVGRKRRKSSASTGEARKRLKRTETSIAGSSSEESEMIVEEVTAQNKSPSSIQSITTLPGYSNFQIPYFVSPLGYTNAEYAFYYPSTVVVDSSNDLDIYYASDPDTTTNITDENSIPVYIRYRYLNETDCSFRLVKRKCVLTRQGVKALHIIKMVIEDAMLSRVPEIRYFEEEDKGWLLLRANDVLPVEPNATYLSIHLLLYSFDS